MDVTYDEWKQILAGLLAYVLAAIVAVPDYLLKLWQSFRRFYSKIYIFLNVFSITYGIMLCNIKIRIEQLALSYDQICALKLCALLWSLILAFLCYFGCLASKLILNQYRVQALARQRSRQLYNFNRQQQLKMQNRML
ncbi:uncharacterized protein [Drosophila virilis]|uniref:uncharacterized protein n=1 Tax=Drosophila virilis TaxID=7244 RepID=UPI00017D4E62|nr:uncharacterized protein LOC116652038 [Drosophila virilis]